MEEALPINEGPISNTVAVVDMVGYSDLARMLEESSGAASVAELNRRIQGFIRNALLSLEATNPYVLLSETGDGAIVLFNIAADAHQFAVGLLKAVSQHNATRTEETARRRFRIGIATGEVHPVDPKKTNSNYAGIAIANSVRLETAAAPGEIVIDTATYDLLPEHLRRLYSTECIVRGKRKEVFKARRYRVTIEASPSILEHQPITRRTFVTLLSGIVGASGVSLWLGRDALTQYLHPLPKKRFVALSSLTESPSEAKTFAKHLLHTIEDRLMRLETVDKDFLLIREDDPLLDSTISKEGLPKTPVQMLGANLLLTFAFGQSQQTASLTTAVVEISSGKTLRRRQLSTPTEQLNAAAAIAARNATRLLDLPEDVLPMEDEEDIGKMPPDAFRLLIDGKALAVEANDASLDGGIEKLQQLVNSYPKIAIGYAELSQAYLRKYQNTKRSEFLELSKANTLSALALNPHSARAILGQAQIEMFSGNTSAAIQHIQQILGRDPLNPEILLYEATIYRISGKTIEEEQVYRKIISNRPNYWPAYNELGYVLQRRAAYQEAIVALQMAVAIVPRVSLPLTNLGLLYMQAGDSMKAKDALDKSIAIYPNEFSYVGLGDLAFSSGNYKAALSSYQSALSVNPNSHSVLRDIGDCYYMLGDFVQMSKAFQRAVGALTKQLEVNPKFGPDWMTLSFYHAKIGASQAAILDLDNAKRWGATDINSRLLEAQTLVLLKRTEEALVILKTLKEKDHLSDADIGLAVDLRKLQSDPRYLNKGGGSGS